jgi:hypothetical protein
MAGCTGAQAATGPTLVTGDVCRVVTTPAAAEGCLLDMLGLNGCCWSACSNCAVCLAGWLVCIVITVPPLVAALRKHAADVWCVHGSIL